MTLDEEIKHCEKKAKELRIEAEQVRDIGEVISNPKQPYNEPVKNCLDCAKEYEQLADWLKELKAYKESPKQGEWIEHYSKEMSVKGYFLCSRCKCGFQRFVRGIRHSDLPWIDGQKYELHCIDNFCPNCGAKMQNGGAE